MSQHTILVIDDSATIRRLAVGALTRAGYQVLAAPTAEEGLQLAERESPDLIILDHQLPGTTGFEVCTQLLADNRLAQIPIVASSTLRKQAYVEYADCSNVIDMLPKPYTEEILLSTVEHAINTGAMVVDSQAHGTAVPETCNSLGDESLSGTFAAFSLREVLDFLNNGSKTGVLEVEAENWRTWFYLRDGRVDAVTSNGVDKDLVTRKLPDSLQSLAPVLNLTISGKGGSELDGLVQLLNNRVLDPRLLQKMLRHQSSVLTMHCFQSAAKTFRFEPSNTLPPLFSDLPLQSSILALLIEAALLLEDSELPPFEQVSFIRKAIRGQNLDRAGLSAKHQKVVGLLGELHSLAQVAQKLGCEQSEAMRVLYALTKAELVEVKRVAAKPLVVLFEPDADRAGQLKAELEREDVAFDVKVAREKLALQLLLKKSVPDALVLPSGNQPPIDYVRHKNPNVAIVSIESDGEQSCDCANATLAQGYGKQAFLDSVAMALRNQNHIEPAATPV
ncbi:MAG: response regulator [Planctomycetales bacterium]|nr:response regulator [Planctomycetales bacterium]